MTPSFMLHIQETLLKILTNPFSSTYEAITLYSVPFQETLAEFGGSKVSLTTPHLSYITIRNSVCSLLFSLAANHRILVYFFSFGY